jgi:serine/threonine protein kinase
MAPEMIKNQQHDHRLDVWCLGIFLYELIHGYAPFKGKNDQEKCRSIISKAKIPFENQISPLAIDLIEGILKINPKERMSLEEIFNHQWLQQYEKVYKIKISNYIWRDERKAKAEQVSPASTQSKSVSSVKVPQETLAKPAAKEQKDSFVLCKNVSELNIVDSQARNTAEGSDQYLLNEDDAIKSRHSRDSNIDIDKYIRDLSLDKTKEISLLYKIEKHYGPKMTASSSELSSPEKKQLGISPDTNINFLQGKFIPTRSGNPIRNRVDEGETSGGLNNSQNGIKKKKNILPNLFLINKFRI